MSAFTSLVGKRVEVNYRAGEVRMTASGILASDSGDNILLEDHYVHSGRKKTMRMEIPYPSLVGVREIVPREPEPTSAHP